MSTAVEELEQIAQTLGPLRHPKKFAIELCAECNLNCAMCHHNTMVRPKGVMPLSLFKRLADQIAEHAPKTELWISFCGEPLLEPERLLEVLRYAREVGLKNVNLNTNGMLLTPEWAGQIIDTGLKLVVFGIDGFSKEVFESFRMLADRDTVYANAEHFLKRRDAIGNGGPEVQVQFIYMDGNEHEFKPLRDHWLARGAVVKARRQLSWGGKLDTMLNVPKDKRIPCPWALTMMHVFWDGRVPRCPGDTEGDEGFGNAWEDSIIDLWAQLGVYRDKHLARQFDELPESCQTCTDWMTGSAKRIKPEESVK